MTFKAASELFTEANIFIIPTFQRPYAWENQHREDMIRDIQVATARQRHNPNTTHYFGAIHTIEVQPDSPLLTDYSDPANEDITTLGTNGFRTTTAIFRVHLVVDGQQRLVTLFGLLERCAGSPMRYVTMPNGRQIPKVILSPATDHELWRSLLDRGNPAPPIATRSQQRLQQLFSMPPQPPFVPSSPEYEFLTGEHTQLMWVQLPQNATLGPFLTLNDRGKDLTKLEKVKSLAMMQASLTRITFCDTWRFHCGSQSPARPTVPHRVNSIPGPTTPVWTAFTKDSAPSFQAVPPTRQGWLARWSQTPTAWQRGTVNWPID